MMIRRAPPERVGTPGAFEEDGHVFDAVGRVHGASWARVDHWLVKIECKCGLEYVGETWASAGAQFDAHIQEVSGHA